MRKLSSSFCSTTFTPFRWASPMLYRVFSCMFAKSSSSDLVMSSKKLYFVNISLPSTIGVPCALRSAWRVVLRYSCTWGSDDGPYTFGSILIYMQLCFWPNA